MGLTLANLAQQTDSTGLVVGFLLVTFALAIYFIPTIVGGIRKSSRLGSVFIINFFLAWTIVGWIVALVMASRSGSTDDAPR